MSTVKLELKTPSELLDDISALKARITELEKALRFYADPNKASGRIARAILSHSGPDGEQK